MCCDKGRISDMVRFNITLQKKMVAKKKT